MVENKQQQVYSFHSFLTWMLSPLKLGMQSLGFHSWDVLRNHPPLWLQTSLLVNNLQTSNQIAVGIQDLNLELFCSKLGKAINQASVLGKALQRIYCSSWWRKYNALTKDIMSKIDQMLQREGLQSLSHCIYYWLTDRLFVLRILGIPLGVNRCQISRVDRCILQIHRIYCIIVIQ